MSRNLKIAAIPVLIALISIGCNKQETGTAPPSGPGPGNPMAGKMSGGPGGPMGGMGGRIDANEMNGATIYSTLCARCHGAGGKGDGPMGARFKPPPTDLTSAEVAKETDAELQKIISEGKEAMPAFQNQLSAEQIGAVLKFIRGLK